MMDVLSKFKRSGKAIDLGTFAMVHVLTFTYMYNIRCIHIHVHRQCIWHTQFRLRVTWILMSGAVLFFSTPQHLPSQIIRLQCSMGNLIRFLLPVCTPHGHVARNHLTKFPKSPINPSGQADPLKAWNQRICIMRNASIPTFVRDTVLKPRQDLLLMVSLYFTTPGGHVCTFS